MILPMIFIQLPRHYEINQFAKVNPKIAKFSKHNTSVANPLTKMTTNVNQSKSLMKGF